MVDVLDLPPGSFGYVPTPALVAPLEFTLPRDAYLRLGGHDAAIRSLPDILQNGGEYPTAAKFSPRGQG
jgi:6-hydroxynicotinate reductase